MFGGQGCSPSELRHWYSGDQAVDRWRIHHRVDQDVCAAGELYEVLRRRGVAGDDDRAVARVEPVGERRSHRRMIDERGGDRDVPVRRHRAALAKLVDVHERCKLCPAFSGDADVKAGRIHLEEELRHPCERRRSPGIDARVQTGRPREQDQVAVVGGVVRMLMGDEDMAQDGKGMPQASRPPRCGRNQSRKRRHR